MSETLLVPSNRLRRGLVGRFKVRVPVETSLELLSSLCVELSACWRLVILELFSGW